MKEQKKTIKILKRSNTTTSSSATYPSNRTMTQNVKTKLINITLHTLGHGPLMKTNHKVQTKQQQQTNLE